MSSLTERYPDYGDPNLTMEQFDEIELFRDGENLDEAYDKFTESEKLPRSLKEYAGLSRQCMQELLLHHLECTGGTRNSCICLCHAENRTISAEELMEGGLGDYPPGLVA